jgi:predicted PurR-regulated permease PerM
MSVRGEAFRPDHPIVVTFLIFAVIGFLALASDFLKPLALAILLSFALAPLASFLERRGVPQRAAVVLTVVLALGVLGAITYQVGEQLTTLARDTKDLSRYAEHIKTKLKWLKPQQENALNRIIKVARDMAGVLEEAPQGAKPVEVRIVSQPNLAQRAQDTLGPFLERLGVVSFVLVLVLFILSNRKDLSDRIIRLFGLRRVSLTTRTMEEAAERISRYLGMFTLVNSSFGLIVGLGLALIGLPFAVVWGVLFAMLRFLPYVGPAAAFALPFLFSVGYFPGWREPILVILLFGTLETLANSFLEPVIYGRTTGVSALGLLVAAMFWTWVWGGLGLLLSTPLTVCLAVLGKYVPGLSFFAILLGEEAPLEPDVRFYHRLLARDRDGATAIVREAAKEEPVATVFDRLLVPTLARAKRDRTNDDIDDGDQDFVWDVVGGLIDELGETHPAKANGAAARDNAGAAPAPGPGPGPQGDPTLHLVGIAANDHADLLVVRMLARLLDGSGCKVTILETPESPLRGVEQVAEAKADLVLVSHLPPVGFTAARYLVRRLRARLAALPIVVGHWCVNGTRTRAAKRLTAIGANRVVFLLAEAHDLVLDRIRAQQAVPRPQGSATAVRSAEPVIVTS